MTSQTFRPEIVYSDELECFFMDVAGFSDTNGEFFDLLNSFVIRYIFLHAKSVRFLLPFTFGELELNRGQAIKDMITQMNLMNNNHMLTYVDSVIPVITKCRTESKHVNYDVQLAN